MPTITNNLTTKSKKNCISRSKLILRPHQSDVVKQFNNQKGIIAIHGVGSGKTLTAVTASQCFLDRNPNKTVIVITPKSLQENFRKELRAYGVGKNIIQYKFFTYNGLFNLGKKAYILCKQNLLIIDEAHNLRTPGSKLATVIIKCSKIAKKILLLSATPLVNSPYDIVNLIAMATGKDPIDKRTFNGLTLAGLKSFLKCNIDYFGSKKNDPNFPKVINKIVKIQMSSDYYKRYQSIECAKSKIMGNNPKAFLHGVRKASNAISMLDSAKIKWVIKKVNNDAKKGKKSLIYTSWVKSGLRPIIKGLQKWDPVMVTGSMSKKGRNKAVEDYNTGRSKVMIITKSGSEGLDLKSTTNMIHVDPVWNRAAEEQITGRAVRYKSHIELPPSRRKVYVWKLILVKPKRRVKGDNILSADEWVLKIMKSKEKELLRFEKFIVKVSKDKLGCGTLKQKIKRRPWTEMMK